MERSVNRSLAAVENFGQRKWILFGVPLKETWRIKDITFTTVGDILAVFKLDSATPNRILFEKARREVEGAHIALNEASLRLSSNVTRTGAKASL